jgi:hypothetical protein
MSEAAGMRQHARGELGGTRPDASRRRPAKAPTERPLGPEVARRVASSYTASPR